MANLRTNNLSGEQGQNAYRGSVFFDGSSSFLSFNAAIWNSTASDSCTFECWLWVTDLSTARNIFDLGSTGDFSIQTDGQIRVHPVASNHMDTNNSITTQSWHHIALVQESGRKDVYINGVKSSMTVGGGDPVASNWANTNANTFNLGDDGVYRDFFRGYMSNVRVLKGVALYDNDFTPPFTELKATDSNTSLLCCQNSDDVTQEETGKTITGNGSLATAGYNKTQPKVIPPYGVDAGNTFGGPIQQSSQGYMYFPTGRTEERGRGRGFYMLGYNGTPSASASSRIDYINIQSQGTTIRFGNLTTNRYSLGAGANSTRGLFTGGYQDGHSPDTDVNAIEFITIATEGNATDFGDRIQVGRAVASASNDTRCVMASAFTPAGYQNTIDFVTIATIGNAQDFGDLSTARAGMSMSCNSTTRGIFNGGYQPAPSTIRVNNMEFITFATTGNTQDFGDLTDDSQSTYGGTASSSTRGLIGLGYVHPARVNSIDFCTIATLGNAQDFGDLQLARNSYGSCSNSTRGVFLGGNDPYTNIIDMVTIATTGDATDFGDVNVGVSGLGAAGSDSHGGLS